MKLHEAKYGISKNATLNSLTKYAKCCVEIICMNQSECRNLIKYV